MYPHGHRTSRSTKQRHTRRDRIRLQLLQDKPTGAAQPQGDPTPVGVDISASGSDTSDEDMASSANETAEGASESNIEDENLEDDKSPSRTIL